MKTIKSWAFAALSASVALGLLVSTCASADSYMVRPNLSIEETSVCIGASWALLTIGKMDNFETFQSVHTDHMYNLKEQKGTTAAYEVGHARGYFMAKVEGNENAVKIAFNVYMKAICVIPSM